VPPALAGVALATAAASALPLLAPSLAARCQVATLAGAAGGAATFAGGGGVLPRILDLGQLAHTPLALWRACAPAAASVAAIAVLETLLAAKVAAAGKPPPPPTSGRHAHAEDRVLLGLGLGNAASALLGGFGGCGLIPQTVLNAQAGGRSRVSSGSYAVATALIVVVFAPLVGAVPVASLSGVMLTVAAATVQVPHSKRVLQAALKQQPPAAAARAWAQLLVLATTSATCFFVDMAAGIGAGVALTALLGKAVAFGESRRTAWHE
jgi:SulP family sulfate permease